MNDEFSRRSPVGTSRHGRQRTFEKTLFSRPQRHGASFVKTKCEPKTTGLDEFLMTERIEIRRFGIGEAGRRTQSQTNQAIVLEFRIIAR